MDLLGIVVQPLDLYLVNVNVASIPTAPTHGKGRLQPPHGDVLKSTPNVWKRPRSGLNLEGRLSDPQIMSGCASVNCVDRWIYTLAISPSERLKLSSLPLRDSLTLLSIFIFAFLNHK